MGMIASLKLGYRVLLLQTLLDVFDQPNGFKKVEVAHLKQPKGCCGMVYGGKPTVLDAMNLLLEVWSDDSKYCQQTKHSTVLEKGGHLVSHPQRRHQQ
jgi:hypothetical protein